MDKFKEMYLRGMREPGFIPVRVTWNANKLNTKWTHMSVEEINQAKKAIVELREKVIRILKTGPIGLIKKQAIKELLEEISCLELNTRIVLSKSDNWKDKL